jgi:hypothetical protein
MWSYTNNLDKMPSKLPPFDHHEVKHILHAAALPSQRLHYKIQADDLNPASSYT